MTRFLTRTAVTKDEAIAYLLRMVDGPVEFKPTDPSCSEEVQDEIDSLVFSIQEELEERLDAALEAYGLAKEGGCPEEELTAAKTQVDLAKRYIKLANDVRIALDHELIQPELLRVDPNWGSPEAPYISIASLRRWAKESSLMADVRKELDAIASNSSAAKAPAEVRSEPWWQPVKGDPNAREDWYTPARYFLRQYLQANPSQRKLSMEKLAEKVAPLLSDRKIFKRGGIEPLAASTIRKAFSRVKY